MGGAKQGYQGALQDLLDHPAVVGILTEILAEEPYLGEDYYSSRCENSFITVRHAGWKSDKGTGLPHVVRPPQQANAMRYQVAGNKIFSGLTRVVWELEEVKAGQGGTAFLSRLTQGPLQLRRPRSQPAQYRRIALGGTHAGGHGPI